MEDVKTRYPPNVANSNYYPYFNNEKRTIGRSTIAVIEGAINWAGFTDAWPP